MDHGAPPRREKLDLAAARRILARADGALSVRSVRIAGEGAKGDVYLAQTDRGAFAIKLYGREFAARMTKERRLLARAEGSGLPLPRLVAYDIEDEALGCPVVVMTALSGERLVEVIRELRRDELRTLFRRIGELQRGLHEIRFSEYTTFLPDDGVFDTNLAFMRERVARTLHGMTLEGERPRLHGALERHFAEHDELFAPSAGPVLCHNDMHEHNLLVTRDADGSPRITGLIDFENAYAADELLDLAKTHNHCHGAGESTLIALIDGYGGLPGEWRPRFELYELMHAARLFTWYSKGGARGPLRRMERRMWRLMGKPEPRDRIADRLARLAPTWKTARRTTRRTTR